MTPADCLVSTATLHGSSRLGEWQRCQRGYHLRYHLNVAPKRKAGALDIGSITHGCMRWVNHHAALGIAAPGGWAAVIAEAERQARESGRFAAAWDEVNPTDEAYRLVAGYYANGAGGGGVDAQGAGWSAGQIVGVERLLEVEIDGIPATCRMDLALDIGGTVHVVDYKSRRNRVPGSVGDSDRLKFIRGAATGEEFLRLSYCAWKVLGLDEPPPVILDALVKTKIAQYERVVLPISRDAAMRWAANYALAGREMQEADLMGDEGVCSFNSCAPWNGGLCWAFDWCHATSDESRFRNFTSEAEGDEKTSDAIQNA